MQINQVSSTENSVKEQTIEYARPKYKENKNNITVHSRELRQVDVACPTYGKSLFDGDATAEDIAQDIGNTKDAAARRNQMVIASNTCSNKDYAAMEQEGYDPMDLEPEEYVNVADKIKMELAKAGKDISAMGGLSREAVQALSDNSIQALAMEDTVKQALQEADLPTEEQQLQDATAVMMKAQETGKLSPAGMKYMLNNHLEPTIDNLYKACYSEARSQQNATGANTNATTNIDKGLIGGQLSKTYQPMQEQIESVIRQAGLEVNEETLGVSQWMLSEDIPLTAENLGVYQQLSKYEGGMSQEDILQKITTSVQEGRSPQDAYLLPGYTMWEHAQEVSDTVEKADDSSIDAIVNRVDTVNVANIALEIAKENDSTEAGTQQPTQEQITARRQLEEVRLLMTTQANYRLMKQGVNIDTQPLEELIQKLKALEVSSQEGMPAVLPEMTQTVEDNYRYFTGRVAGLRNMPAAILTPVEDASKATVDELYAAGTIRRDTYERANVSYETLWTSPRADMGDTITKAFQNVDDILDDLGLEPTNANERAVRILGYNSMEITPENIARIKASDEAVQRLFGNLTGNVVTEMMKQNVNPLDMKIEDLNELAEKIQDETGATAIQERFSKYLWKLEQNHEITPEQRESFIGVFRLIHQVEATDGAAVGSLVQAGVEPTMRNLMTAVRSSKHMNRTYGIDDSFGELDSYNPDKLSIIQQIEVAYQSSCIRDVADEITPNKMTEFENEDAYMNLTPEKLSEALQNMENQQLVQEEAKLDEQYQEITRQTVAEAVANEEQVYEILKQYDLPATPANLQAMQQLMTNRNQVFRTLMHPVEDGSEDGWSMDYEGIMEDLIEDFGEAIKTPRDMAKAQQKLADTAENVMKNMLVEKDVSTIDVKNMKLVTSQIMVLGQMAKKNDTYSIPIMVGDEVGNLTLKIVPGEDEKGLVDIAFDMESTGCVSAAFHYEAGTIEGRINSSSQDTRNLLAEHMGLIAENMTKATGTGVSFTFGWDSLLDAGELYDSPAQQEAENKTQGVQTSQLYGLAKSFVDTLGEIFK